MSIEQLGHEVATYTQRPIPAVTGGVSLREFLQRYPGNFGISANGKVQPLFLAAFDFSTQSSCVNLTLFCICTWSITSFRRSGRLPGRLGRCTDRRERAWFAVAASRFEQWSARRVCEFGRAGGGRGRHGRSAFQQFTRNGDRDRIRFTHSPTYERCT